MASVRLRRLSLKGLALLWLSTLISGLGLASARADDGRTDLCRWLGPPATGEPCDGSAWRALVQERAAAAPL
ncbi:MAG: hypothetical protein ACREIR_10775, partial [Geminicoccaceae bacterium]